MHFSEKWATGIVYGENSFDIILFIYSVRQNDILEKNNTGAFRQFFDNYSKTSFVKSKI